MLISRCVPRSTYFLFAFSFLFFASGCNTFVYLPKSAKQKYFARPHIQFMMAVVEFRESTGGWPFSLYELQYQTEKNKKIIDDFQYRYIYFLPRKNDRLEVFFDDYKKELYLDVEGKTDLNRFSGVINFYKSNGKFVWKVKMR